MVDARKERFDRQATWELVKDANKIITAKGKKVLTWNPKTDDPELILKSIMGPSGNLRAPTLQLNNQFLIGFHASVYENWINTSPA